MQKNEDRRKTSVYLHFQRNSKGPESAVFVPESAVFPTYDLEVSKIFRIFVLAIRIQVQRRFCFQNDRSGCRIRPAPRSQLHKTIWIMKPLTLKSELRWKSIIPHPTIGAAPRVCPNNNEQPACPYSPKFMFFFIKQDAVLFLLTVVQLYRWQLYYGPHHGTEKGEIGYLLFIYNIYIYYIYNSKNYYL